MSAGDSIGLSTQCKRWDVRTPSMFHPDGAGLDIKEVRIMPSVELCNILYITIIFVGLLVKDSFNSAV